MTSLGMPMIMPSPYPLPAGEGPASSRSTQQLHVTLSEAKGLERGKVLLTRCFTSSSMTSSHSRPGRESPYSLRCLVRLSFRPSGRLYAGFRIHRRQPILAIGVPAPHDALEETLQLAADGADAAQAHLVAVYRADDL